MSLFRHAHGEILIYGYKNISFEKNPFDVIQEGYYRRFIEYLY